MPTRAIGGLFVRSVFRTASTGRPGI